MALGGSNRVRIPDSSAEPSSCLHALGSAGRPRPAGSESTKALPTPSPRDQGCPFMITDTNSTILSKTVRDHEFESLRSAGGACDRLVLEVSHEPLRAKFAADAAGLVAAEGGAGLDHVHVDAVGARAHLAGDFHAAFGIRGPHGSGQAVVAVVRDADRVRLVLIRNDGQDGAEDFLAGDAHRRVDASEHGGSNVPAPLPARGLGTARHDLGALVLPDLDVALHPVLLPLRDQGAELAAAVRRVA